MGFLEVGTRSGRKRWNLLNWTASFGHPRTMKWTTTHCFWQEELMVWAWQNLVVSKIHGLGKRCRCSGRRRVKRRRDAAEVLGHTETVDPPCVALEGVDSGIDSVAERAFVIPAEVSLKVMPSGAYSLGAQEAEVHPRRVGVRPEKVVVGPRWQGRGASRGDGGRLGQRREKTAIRALSTCERIHIYLSNFCPKSSICLYQELNTSQTINTTAQPNHTEITIDNTVEIKITEQRGETSHSSRINMTLFISIHSMKLRRTEFKNQNIFCSINKIMKKGE